MKKLILLALVLMGISFVGCSTREDPYKTKALEGLAFSKVEIATTDLGQEESSLEDSEMVRIAVQAALAKAGAKYDAKSGIYFKGKCHYSKANFPKVTLWIEAENVDIKLSSTREVQSATSSKIEVINYVADDVIRDFAQQWVKSPEKK